ncbi:hypothetical protein [Aeromicrobium sp. CTD01-1L150]|uniref:hypothetical protein n=1 Tax=Aeromicrobium sp. CTD01-1L150 TaxID=3341830 RepID=UPI0035C0A0DE
MPHRPAHRRSATTVVAVVALGTGLLAATSTASQADSTPEPTFDQCAAAFPHTALEEGQAVTGLTNTTGTRLDQFNGSFVGTLKDGIGRGRDMLLFTLEGSRITKPDGSLDAGIWAGISGSPVYAENGELVGAVSYGFTEGSDTLAGVTPASYLYDLKSLTPPEEVSLRSLRPALARQDVRVPGTASLDRIGSARQVSGFRSGSLPTVQRLARRAGIDPKGLSLAASSVGTDDVPVRAGGSAGASWSYGDISAVAVGSVTAVCDDDVYAFGHADEWAGETAQTLHGVQARGIARGTFGSFKLGSVGSPAGTFSQDRLEGLYGTLGDIPISVDLLSTTRLGTSVTPGATTVTEIEQLPFIVAAQVASDVQSSQNAGYAGGQSRIKWTVDLVRANGKEQTFTRSQRYSTRSDLAELVVSDVASDVHEILENPFEPVTIGGITITNDLAKDYRAYRIAGVERYSAKKWRAVKNNAVVKLKRGSLLKLRLKLVPKDRFSNVKATTRNVSFRTSKFAARNGRVDVVGHALAWDDWGDFEDFEDYGYYDEYDDSDPFVVPTKEPRTLTAQLALMAKSPGQDQIVSTVAHRGRNTGRLVNTSKTSQFDAIVFGSHRIRLRFS